MHHAPFPSRCSTRVLCLATARFFFVRHGESRWNRAQQDRNLYEILRTTDHPLTGAGRNQAETLAARLAEAADEPSSRAAPMLRPDVVFTSPLVRALETAMIALGQVLTKPGAVGELVLMPNAREKKSYAGDTRSTKVGSEIMLCAFEELRALYKDNEDSLLRSSFCKLRYDATEVQERWWHDGPTESASQLQARAEKFLSQLLYSPHQNIVVVGHSLFFRTVFRRYLSDEFKAREPALAHAICSRRLSNCGVLRLELSHNQWPGGMPIVSAELVLGSMLEDGQARTLCTHRSEPGPAPPINSDAMPVTSHS
eukprot:NODE_13026_length_1189_cov_15.820151.p1 GENE.NODE_13026_length_1189_cov_15.820151~~NODE_13026_length_1189_cov_15.820151.p1  ORF type:complete len:312 (-),score=57.08 NODE_13026_length_1189_cov_15.820151:12-947(-)